jgi:pimeloyl-ACP methyl ester carboxylesterase
MGVQVALEAYRSLGPSVVRSLVLLNGTFGRPLDSAPVPFARHLVPSAIDVAERLAPALGAVTRTFVRGRGSVRLMKKLGLLGESLDEDQFREVTEAFGALDMRAFMKNLRALGDHDASRILPRISVPVLVITGDHDRMTPRGLSQQMVRRIPSAEILVVRGGTHYTAAEFPELVGLRVERFFHDQGY